jgi:hypothetical protein
MHTTTAADVVLAIWGQENVPLTVGEVPVAFPRELVPPEPVVTLGGATTGGAVIAAFRFPPGARDVMTSYAELAREHGWSRDTQRSSMPFGGFDFIVYLKHQTTLTFRAALPTAVGTVMVVTRGPEGGAPDFERHRFRPDFGELVLPPLEPLPGARFVGGGSGGGGDHFTPGRPADHQYTYARHRASLRDATRGTRMDHRCAVGYRGGVHSARGSTRRTRASMERDILGGAQRTHRRTVHSHVTRANATRLADTRSSVTPIPARSLWQRPPCATLRRVWCTPRAGGS